MTSCRRHQHPYNTHTGMVINREKFDVCTSSSFGGVNAHVHTYLPAESRFIQGESGETDVFKEGKTLRIF